jgi:predicted acylesterase/phospholipase RssA
MLDSPLTCLVLSGGLGLGAYHGGAFERLHRQAISLDWIMGSSAGCQQRRPDRGQSTQTATVELA